MDMVKLKNEITVDEGRRKNPYKDTAGIWTAGIGHNLSAHGASWTDISTWLAQGVPVAVIDKWYDDDIADAITCCKDIFPTFDVLPDNVQRVLANLGFDLMWELKEWPRLRAAIASEDWQGAAMAVLDSKFAQQAPARCGRLAVRMVGG